MQSARRAATPLVASAFIALLIAMLSVPASAQSPNLDEASCRGFVQGFYDSYWNRFADKFTGPKKDPNFHFPGIEEVLKRNPPALSRQLIDLIRKDEKQSRESNEVGNLDFDPFLNSQDPVGIYRVGRVELRGDVCMATIDRAHTVADLKRNGPGWLFVNFHYSYFKPDGKTKDFPDDDLLHILQPDSSGAKVQK